jgi:hypothetical protein
MKWIALLLFCLGAGAVFLGLSGYRFTESKIEKMEMIRGIKPGAISREVIVTDKLRTETPLDPPTYWISWNDANIHVRSNERMNLTKDHWDSIQVGDPFTLTFVGDDSSPYHADGIFASDGNLAFDRVLQFIEIGIVGFGVILLIAPILVFVIGWRKSAANKTRIPSPITPRVD